MCIRDRHDGVETTYEDVYNNLITRDKIDSERDVAPLKQAEDAIHIDNTNINKEQTIELILSHILKSLSLIHI